jgi:stearoyl-CoA desaturase (delta-9 desaturase)
MFPQIPFHRVNWLVSSFLIGTLFLSVTAVPLYLCFFGIDWFQITLFFAMLGACGFSITLGYHRLFSHLTFQAHWIVRFFAVIFGAGAFEHSVLLCSCEHRSHHKHVDHDDDPYCITKGLFYAHMGWTQRKAGQLEVTHEMLTNLRNEIRVATNALRLPALRRGQPS